MCRPLLHLALWRQLRLLTQALHLRGLASAPGGNSFRANLCTGHDVQFRPKFTACGASLTAIDNLTQRPRQSPRVQMPPTELPRDLSPCDKVPFTDERERDSCTDAANGTQLATTTPVQLEHDCPHENSAPLALWVGVAAKERRRDVNSYREYTYPAIRLFQTSSSKPILIMAAPAYEIDVWAGVPQRRRLAGEETVGWQREVNPSRLNELTKFFRDKHNVVQNPLLCALQDPGAVQFRSDTADSHFGEVVIKTADYASLSLLEVLKLVRDALRARAPSLENVTVDRASFEAAMERAREVGQLAAVQEASEDDDEAEAAALDADLESADLPPDSGVAFFAEETQLLDFYQELIVRVEILERLGPDQPEELLGFSRDAMLSYLKPVVLVDGQHRLRGSVLAAEEELNSDGGVAQQMAYVDDGAEASEAKRRVLDEVSRQLPVSLLMDPSPAEHVFQFVVVNQKATPMGRALLGTIVSTSLTRDELEPVADRLRRAGVPLDDSQAVAFLTRSETSPFFGLVQTGVSGDDRRHLKWTVLTSLTTIFRELNGGRLYGQNNDYAAIWRERHLADSKFVADGADANEKFAIWSAADGPWRDVFVRFFGLVRDRFGSDDMNAQNAWGNTSSNLYNKIHLTILAADYFQFLVDKEISISDVDGVTESVTKWLQGTNEGYFNRDWKMGNLKKDQQPVKLQWARVWSEYRRNPARLPRVENYRP